MNQNKTHEEKETNIRKEGLYLLKELAESNEMDIITRPINPLAFNQMERGAPLAKICLFMENLLIQVQQMD